MRPQARRSEPLNWTQILVALAGLVVMAAMVAVVLFVIFVAYLLAWS